MPAITVMTTTSRDLFMREKIDALKNQTFKDFEWLLVDDLRDKRHNQLLEMIGGAFPLVHVKPTKITEYMEVAAAQNDGLIKANGELVYFMIDYVLPYPDVLEKMWRLYKDWPPALLSGACIEVDFLPPRLPPPGEHFSGSDYRAALFQNNDFRWDNIRGDLYEAYRDGAQNWWGGRNDAAPLRAILECNGFDEELDGGYGYHDEDLAQRLMTYGLRYYIDKSIVCLQFPHEKAINGGKKARREWSEQQWFKNVMIPRKVRQGVYTANPERNLREEWDKR